MSLYKPEYADRLIEFFARPAWDRREGDTVVEGNFPTLAAFCCEIKVCQKTLWNWANAKDIDGATPLYPDWVAAYALAKEYQEKHFTQGYMRGAYANPAIGQLIAKNLMNWRDKQEVESNVVQHVTATVEVPGLADRFAAVAKKVNVSE